MEIIIRPRAMSLLLLLSVSATAVWAQPSPAASRAPAPVTPAPEPTPLAAPSGNVVVPGVELTTKTQLDTLQRSVENVLKKVEELASKGPDLTVPLFGLLGVLVGGAIQAFIALRGAKGKREADMRLAQEKSKFDVAKSIVDWKLKQLAELYGPLRTLFAQSNAVYRTMNVVLQNADPNKFKLLEPKDMEAGEFACFSAEADNDGHLFIIRCKPELSWERFRTVLYIDEVYGKDYQVELYFDRTVDISSRIVTVIETKAGLALSEESGETLSTTGGDKSRLEDSLRHKFGQFLAHAAVLQSIHANRRAVYRKSIGEEVNNEPLALNLVTHRSAAFPQDIQRMVGTAYTALQRSIAQWEVRAD